MMRFASLAIAAAVFAAVAMPFLASAARIVA
jgi:hypothetical protein